MPTNQETPPGSPKLADFEWVEWRPLVTAGAARSCDEIWHVLLERFQVADDEATRRVLRLLLHVTGFVLGRTSRRNPVLQPRFPGVEVSALASSDLAAADVLLGFRDLHPDLRARLLDIYFQRKRGNVHDWRRAPAAYVEAASAIAVTGDLDGLPERLERAWSLSQILEVESADREVVAFVEKLLLDAQGHVPKPEHVTLVQMRFEMDDPDLPSLARSCEEWAKHAELEQTYIPFRRRILIVGADAYARANLEDDERRLRLEAAETYVEEAEHARQRDHMPRSAEAHFLEYAIHALRRIPRTHDRRDALHRRMLEVQKGIPGEFGRIDGPYIDLSDLALKSIAMVSGEGLTDALFKLATFPHVPSRSKQREEAEAIAQQALFSFLIPTVVSDERGRTVQKRSGPNTSGDPDGESALLNMMHRQARWHRACVVRGSIDPARRQIASEHPLELWQIMHVLRDSPFIPDGRLEGFCTGLHAGLCGDLIVTAHVLIPQVEHAIRRIVESRGGLVSTLRDDGIQEWTLLGTLLASSEAFSIFGEDHVFCLQGLLGREGSNLRNDVAHGLTSDQDMWSTEIVYFWWLTLRFCVMPLLGKGDVDLD